MIELNVSLGISDYAKKTVFVQTALTREQMLEHDRIPGFASVMSSGLHFFVDADETPCQTLCRDQLYKEIANSKHWIIIF